MTTTLKQTAATSIAACVAPEDVGKGDFLVVLNETVELPSFFWNGSGASLAPDELIRFRYLPEVSGTPLKVIEVCLPFVYVMPPNGRLHGLDVRRTQLARMQPDCGEAVWNQLQKPFRKTRKKKKKAKKLKRLMDS